MGGVGVIKEIRIKFIPRKLQRYDTSYDWQIKDGVLTIRITRSKDINKKNDWRYDIEAGIHEMVEALLCDEAGITDKVVDEWDMGFEHTGAFSGGNHPASPYRREHFFASALDIHVKDILNLSRR
jgi:hypothetical protein